MKKLTLILGLMVAALAGFAQHEDGGRITLRGVVVDSQKLPVSGAKFWFSVEGPQVVTDSLGRFNLNFQAKTNLVNMARERKTLLFYVETNRLRVPLEFTTESFMSSQVITLPAERK